MLDGEIRQTCTACATTLLLEFGYLSHLTGNSSYGRAAAGAARAVFAMRSRSLGLPGNTLDCDERAWVRQDSGIGAGADSYYEYLLKVRAVWISKEAQALNLDLPVQVGRGRRAAGADSYYECTW